MHIRRLLVNIHYFGGLACFWYLIVLGVSSLHFNHRFSFGEDPGDTIQWSRPLHLQPIDTARQDLSETIRDSLALAGWPLFWETRFDSTGVYHFTLEQPARRYLIAYSFNDYNARITEIRKNFWQVFVSLHGAGEVPNAPVMTVWMWYTRLTIVVVLISLFTGIYIWIIGKRDKKSGNAVLIGSLFATLLWMAFMYLHG